MNRVFLLFLLLLPLAGTGFRAAGQSNDISGRLEELFRGMRDNITSEKKLEKNDSARMLISSYAASDTVFRHRFSNLRFLGQITSPDSLVKIITWNLILNDGGNRYFCYLIKREKKQGGGKVCFLTGLYNEGPIRTDTTYSASNWYGALYYDIRPFVSGGTIHYILLGIDYGNSFVSRKVIDVLTFGPDCDLVLGLKCFSDGKVILPRVVFEYAATGVMSLKFESDNLIVFDHLSPVSPEFKGNRQFYGPDFSFDSYTLDKEIWRLKTDIDIKNK
jgi:hypothetical protein